MDGGDAAEPAPPSVSEARHHFSRRSVHALSVAVVLAFGYYLHTALPFHSVDTSAAFPPCDLTDEVGAKVII